MSPAVLYPLLGTDIGARRTILVLAGIPDPLIVRLAERYNVVDARETGVLAQAAHTLGTVEGAACTGRALLGEAEVAALPSLTVVSSYSAGLDGIDQAALARRAIALHSTSHVLAGAVADLAVVSLLCLLRQVTQADAFVRAGDWATGTFPLCRGVQECRVGLLGMGHIGKAVARRLHAFDMEVAYCARSQKAERPERFFTDVAELARWADALVVACSATPETRLMVGQDVVSALGRDGVLVNVARGSIVDEMVLTHALRDGRLAGAALDVFSNEPHVSSELLGLKNVLLTPHIGSATVATRAAMADATLAALNEHFRRPGAPA